jgi:hypothetical protein
MAETYNGGGPFSSAAIYHLSSAPVAPADLRPYDLVMTQMRTSLLTMCILLVPWAARAQGQPGCRDLPFPDSAPESAVLTIDQLQGQLLFAPPEEAHEMGGVSGVCVVLFDRRDRRALSVVVTDEGRFSLPRPGPGTYLLVASMEPLRPLAIPIQLSSPALGPDAGRGLLLHMRATEDSRTSYATVISHLELRRELLEMARADQDVRQEWIRKGVTTPDSVLAARMAAIDTRNTKRMLEIIKQHGWPGPELVGLDGGAAGFLMVQHAELQVQQALFPLADRAYRDGALSGPNYALLLDRIRVREGKRQLYGTQAKDFSEWKGKEPAFEPIEDEANVDRRRAEVGLPPLAEYREMLKRMYFPPA